MRCEFEHAVKYKIAALEEHVSPIPSVILDDVMSLSFYPEVKADKRDAT